MSAALSTCVLCPRLCRPACPVATGSAREAAVPTLIATALFRHRRGELPGALAAEALTLCVDCGACQEHCHLHQPLPAMMRAARAELLAEPAAEALRPIEGSGVEVAVESHDRPYAEALAAALGLELGAGLGRWVTGDRLGAALLGHPAMLAHREKLRVHALGRRLLVADGGIARLLHEAEVPFTWLHERLPALAGEALGSCATRRTREGEARPEGPLACCGGADPFLSHHPEDAARTGRFWLERASTPALLDARCHAHLRAAGGAPEDAIDRLHAMVGDRGRPQ